MFSWAWPGPARLAEDVPGAARSSFSVQLYCLISCYHLSCYGTLSFNASCSWILNYVIFVSLNFVVFIGFCHSPLFLTLHVTTVLCRIRRALVYRGPMGPGFEQGAVASTASDPDQIFICQSE